MVYNDIVVKRFAFMTVIWGIVGMLVGVIIAAELIWPDLNFGIPFLSYGRLRPLHTNAVIFAFGGSALFATSYYIVQRTCHVRLFSDKLANFTFWGWQLVIVLAAVTLPLGITQGKEYAELEWPIDILITIVWVAYAVVFFGTLAVRKNKHIYVANWFFSAYIITIAVLHIVNNVAVPVSLTKSYDIYSGVVDAMVEWWYGHNAVGFFLTAAFLGMMYYFVPKQAGRPIYSYRLSIVHFWALISIYMWAGPHHLHYTSLPDWAQTLGMVFSVILLAPSWGGMINGIMTLSGAWHKLRTDPILKFLIVSLSFYGMSTFEGPMMSIKTVNALSHDTDWTIGHVHSGALGWVAFMTHRLVVLHDAAALGPQGNVEHTPHRPALLDRHHRRGAVRVGHVDRRRDAGLDVARDERRRNPDLYVRRIAQGHVSVLRRAPGRRHYVPGGHVHHALQRRQDDHGRVAPVRAVAAGRLIGGGKQGKNMNHEIIEKRAWLMGTLIAIVISVGGIGGDRSPVHVRHRSSRRRRGSSPTARWNSPAAMSTCAKAATSAIRRWSARCRPRWSVTATTRSPARRFTTIRSSSARSGPGPDLARVGGRYSDEWHRIHLNNPRDVVPESNMPAFVWLVESDRGPRGGRSQDARAAANRRALHGCRHQIGRRPRDRSYRARRAHRLSAGFEIPWGGLHPMIIGLVRAMITLVLLLLFIGLFVWAWSGRRKSLFDQMAKLPLDDEEA